MWWWWHDDDAAYVWRWDWEWGDLVRVRKDEATCATRAAEFKIKKKNQKGHIWTNCSPRDCCARLLLGLLYVFGIRPVADRGATKHTEEPITHYYIRMLLAHLATLLELIYMTHMIHTNTRHARPGLPQDPRERCIFGSWFSGRCSPKKRYLLRSRVKQCVRVFDMSNVIE